MVCWQTYISALDEDLGKAQARMDGILSADGNSTSKQNEMLKAAAKQVCLPACLPVCLSVCLSVCLYPPTAMQSCCWTQLFSFSLAAMVCSPTTPALYTLLHLAPA